MRELVKESLSEKARMRNERRYSFKVRDKWGARRKKAIGMREKRNLTG